MLKMILYMENIFLPVMKAGKDQAGKRQAHQMGQHTAIPE